MVNGCFQDEGVVIGPGNGCAFLHIGIQDTPSSDGVAAFGEVMSVGRMLEGGDGFLVA